MPGELHPLEKRREEAAVTLIVLSVLALALLAISFMFHGCVVTEPPLGDAGAVGDLALVDPRPAAPVPCTTCSWTEPYMGCIPSLCQEYRGGALCCPSGGRP